MAAHGLASRLHQVSLSFNPRAGTLRGLHFQEAPHREAKLVRCTRGRVFDVAVDLRPDSPTYRGWAGAELDPENGDAFYVPEGCAHGLLTLADDTEVVYHIAGGYAPAAQRGVRWDDPAFGIAWPMPPAVINDRDATFPDFTG